MTIKFTKLGAKMAGKQWKKQEIQFLKDNCQKMTCSEIASKIGRTTKSTQHKYLQLGLEKRKAKIGEIVNDWKIVDIYNQYNGSQNVSMAKIESTINNKEKTVRLSILSNNQIGNPVVKRPDTIERNTTHGKSRDPLYGTWNGMIARCSNVKHVSYDNYGGKGVKVCNEWTSFDTFFKWANFSGYEEHLTLDRIEGDGDYCPENCRWATKIEQSINRRTTNHLTITAFEETKHIIEWLHDPRCKVGNLALRYRIRAGWESELALTQPAERKSKKNLKNWMKDNYPNILKEYQDSQ